MPSRATTNTPAKVWSLGLVHRKGSSWDFYATEGMGWVFHCCDGFGYTCEASLVAKFEKGSGRFSLRGGEDSIQRLCATRGLARLALGSRGASGNGPEKKASAKVLDELLSRDHGISN